LPILGGNAAELLTDYDGAVNRLVADIDAAGHHVHLLFYIFADDETAGRVIDALRRAARRGVECRVLADSVGSRRWFRSLHRKLTEAGVEVEEALPVGWLRWRRAARLDLRNHRKIAVIDGRVGYTGSQNLVNAKYRDGLTYDELVVRVTGPAVLELQYVFVGDWFLETEETLDGPDYFPDPVRAGDVPVQALPSGPGYPTENNQRLLVALIHGADERVVMTTPYFIPDEPLLQAMQTAVLRGVEVHLIVSQQADSGLVTLAQRSYYGQMLEDGIKIHAYKKHFLHAKHLSIDDELAIIGSSNMDIRSFMLNAEISLLFYDDDVTRRLHAEEEGYLRYCDELTAETWHRRPFVVKVAQRIARLMSPLL
jgi:cardiolipin synthase